MELLTHTRVQSFLRCRRKHYFEYILGVRRLPTEALRLGTAVGLGVEILKNGGDLDEVMNVLFFGEDTADEQMYDSTRAYELVRGWQKRWKDSPLEYIHAEYEFRLPLMNSAPRGRQSKTYQRAGKIDGIVKLEDGRIAIDELKTTADPIDPDSDYWDGLRLDRQITYYLDAAQKLKAETILYDVIRKPQLHLKKATPEDKRKYKKDGTLYANMRDKDESLEEFAIRYAAALAADPEHYYQRREIPRLQSDIDQVRVEYWQIAKDMRKSALAGTHYRNTGACRAPYPCPYREVCSNDVDLSKEVPEGFYKLEGGFHPELANQGMEIENDKTDTTTSPEEGTNVTGQSGAQQLFDGGAVQSPTIG